ncbi:hypothetical protein GQ651_05225 [Alphaproteobacteria bacterium GH1-50]|uniref:Hedgehog/Intein (Hint) domain-containing protein n=1 Tax=Kangsaoukella pontilimi TaxID=2691042 RepID=A0A7C9IGY7_9RHOB|nr:Hint domain-containing protein [Kangsaoukella pontilimi]MXQ07242.1 hypothetical protein [Kangsaoukella pontilimi]
MAQLSFWARGDSNTANNASLNVETTNTTPTTLLTFETWGDNGDLSLDLNGGQPDPDTRVYLGDGTEPLEFTVEFRGILPGKNTLNGVGPGNADLRGKEVTIITLSTGERLFIVTDDSTLSLLSFDPDDAAAKEAARQTMENFPNGAFALTNVVVCYAAGTLIATPEGPCPVEALTPGDLLVAADGAPVRVRLVVARTVHGIEMRIFETLRPVTLPAGLFGPGRPMRDLTVTPLHRILVEDPELDRLFGAARMYVHARDLPGALPAPPSDRTFVHVLCDRHAALIAEGIPSESLFPGDVALMRLSAAQRAEIDAALPERPRQTAFPCLTRKEAAVWRAAVQRREKRTA